MEENNQDLKVSDLPQNDVNNKLKHSGFGIASFVLVIVTILLFCIMFVISFIGISDYINFETGEVSYFDKDTGKVDMDMVTNNYTIIAGLIGYLCVFLLIIALILGIIGLVLKNRKKVFAILGVAFSSIFILGYIGLTIISLIMAGII